MIMWIITAILGDRITPYDPFNDFGESHSPPGVAHVFGTDRLGRDVLSRVMVGSRDVLIVAPLAAIVGVVAGTLLGLIMGFYRGIVDDILSRLVEAFLALPVILVALLTLVVLGSSPLVVVAVVGTLFTPIVARTVRSAVLSERQLDYVTAARLRGESGLFILSREIFPNVLGPTVVELTVRFGYAIFTVATLSFLGVGDAAALAGLGPVRERGIHEHDLGRVVAHAVPGARHREHGHRGEPHRGFAPVGAERMTIETTAPPPPPSAPTTAALKVEDLSLAYVVRGIQRPVLRGVSFEVRPGESYGLVGESGCGKSTTAYAAVRYLPRNAVITGGRILVAGDDVTKMSGEQLRRFRMQHVSMVYQDPGAALNPTTKVGPQVVEAFTILGQDAEQARRAPWPRCDGSRSPTPSESSSAIRTSSRAGCSSASSSRSRWRPTRSSSCSTNPRPASMRRWKRACSISCGRS